MSDLSDFFFSLPQVFSFDAERQEDLLHALRRCSPLMAREDEDDDESGSVFAQDVATTLSMLENDQLNAEAWAVQFCKDFDRVFGNEE